MKTVEILKRNRKYFAASAGGYKCKILIDSNSEQLEVGTHELELTDISVRTKYGTDLIFKLSSDIETQKSAGFCTLKTEFYNSILVEQCRKLGGNWDSGSGAWVFSGLVESEIEALDELWNSELIGVEIEVLNDLSKWQGPVEFYGFTIARAFGRDSGAKLAEGISLMNGRVNSGGSVKNWTTCIDGGSIIRMYMPKLIIDLAKKEHEDALKITII